MIRGYFQADPGLENRCRNSTLKGQVNGVAVEIDRITLPEGFQNGDWVDLVISSGNLCQVVGWEINSRRAAVDMPPPAPDARILAG